MITILRKKADIFEARTKMRHLGIDFTSSLPERLLRKAGFIKGVSIGDRRKSWDVLKTANFLLEHVPVSSPILDIGAYASEILCILHKFNYKDLTGIDLNPHLARMPYSDEIRYEVCNFMQAPFKDSSFKAITAISVIEHGFQRERLLKEIARILQHDGFFIASFDYWPEKINTTGINPFGMDWIIFSRKDLKNFIIAAEEFNLFSVGEVNFEAQEYTIKWNSLEYTFGWMTLQKKSG